MKRFFLSLILAFTAITTIFAQDTIKVMSYNTLNYGTAPGSSCPTFDNSPKNGYLRNIVAYENPDILGLVKMTANEQFAYDTILDNVLNIVCPRCYWHSLYMDNSGYSKVSMLYYKVNKFAIASVTQLYIADPNIADIDAVKFYYLNPDLAKNHDTAYLSIILVHLLSTSADSNERGTEMKGVMASLAKDYPSLKNFILMGDFNVKRSAEVCFQAAINPSDTNYKFYDVSNEVGAWHDNPSKYAKYLTVDTRTASLSDCGSYGGMTDWFDHILATKDIMAGTDSITYVPNSFTTVGQDGLHTNNALIDNPQDVIVPANVLSSVYYMSNHLPVTAKFVINRQKALPLAIMPTFNQPSFIKYTNPIQANIYFTLEDNTLVGQKVNAAVYNLLGREIYNSDITLATENTIALQPIAQGMYIVRLTQNGRVIAQSRIVKE